tara:strand:+ start:23 stop:1312 length:1290 start_codon:yes stop_codon:yes gene_type:complete
MKSLKRPMFNRGGTAKNTGIVSGFDPDPQGRVGFNSGDLVTTPQERSAQVLQAYRDAGILKEPTLDTSFTPADYLRIASAGAQIMGAPASGQSGLRGALTAAANPLANLGMDLASSYDAKRAAFRESKQTQDALTAQAIDTGFTMDLDEFERVLQAMNFLEDRMAAVQTEGNPDYIADEEARNAEVRKLERQYLTLLIRESGQDLTGDTQLLIAANVQQAMAAQYPDLVPGTPEYKKIADELTRAESQKAQLPSYNLQMNKGGRVGYNQGDMVSPEDVMTRPADNEERMADIMAKLQAGLLVIDPETGRIIPAPTKKPDQPRQDTRPAMNEEIAADAARRAELNKMYGKAEGGFMAPTKQGQSPKGTDAMLTFEELRARLPQEVTDSVVRLLASSTSALLDFANIETEQDIAMFNQKYSSDLQLPTQVA